MKYLFLLILIPNLALASIESDINQYRKEQGLSELKIEKPLKQSAQYKVNDMISHRYFAHTNPFGDGLSKLIVYRKWTIAGEVLSKNYTEREVVKKWVNSPTHKAILTDDFSGVGCYNKDNLIACHFIKI